MDTERTERRGARTSAAARAPRRATALAALAVVSLLVGCGPRTAQVRARGFVRVDTPDVHLRTDLDHGRAVALAERMQRMREYFAERPFPCARGIELPPIEVVALRHEEDLVGLVGRSVGGYFSRAPVAWLEPQLVISTDEVDERHAVRVFNHELAHRFVALCYPRAPVWLNEGIAELFETVRAIDDERVRLGVSGYLFGQGWAWTHREIQTLVVPRDRVPSFSRLRAMSDREFYAGGDDDDERSRRTIVHYAAAWSAVHLLEIGDPQLHARFGRYLHALRRSDAPEDLLWETAFRGVDLDAAMRRYQRSGTYRSTIDELPPRRGPAPALTPMTEADAHLMWAELSLRRGRGDATLDHLQLARAQGGASARSALLRGTIAWLDRHPARAREIFDEGARLAPASAPLLRARVAAGVASGAQAERAAADVEALRARAEVAQDFAVLAESALARHDTSAAIALAGRGIRKNRLCWRCLGVLGRAYLEAGQPTHAVGPLEVAFALLTHGGGAERQAIGRALSRARRQSTTPVGDAARPTGDDANDRHPGSG